MPGSQKRSGFFARLKHTFAAEDGTLRPFRLLKEDVGKLTKRYYSDWTTFNQVVIASAIFVFFTNLLPGITFASDLSVNTGQNYGTIEIVFSTGLCNSIFSFFSLQPLTILGVTGPFSVITENLYSLVSESMGVPFLPFMAWSLIHTCWMLWLLAIFNAHEWTMLYVTDFTCEIFGLLTSIIYFSKAIQEFQQTHAEKPLDAFLYSVINAVGTFLLALLLSSAEGWAPMFPKHVRSLLRQYATPIAVVFFVGIGYTGDVAPLDKGKLLTSSERFAPSSPDRTSFFVHFWDISPAYIGVSMISGAIITVLFFFDHEISTIMCTAKKFRTCKPSGFALEIMLLGVTTAICGMLGIPPANGLLPQAPLHSESLIYTVLDEEEAEDGVCDSAEATREKPVWVPGQRICEQRWSRFIHAGCIMVCMAPPLQRVLGLIHISVLSGLFLFMGYQNLSTNPILRRTLYILTPASQLPPLPSGIKSVWAIHGYTSFQITVATVAFIVSLTQAGPAFPIVVVACVPFRLLVIPRIWSRETLRYVDKWSCRDGSPEDDEHGTYTPTGVGAAVTLRLLPSLQFSTNSDPRDE